MKAIAMAFTVFLIRGAPLATAGPLDDTIRFDMQFQGERLPARTYLQGTTPRIRFDLFNNGRNVTTTPADTWMVYRAAADAEADTWLTATNTPGESTGGVYIVQLPSLSTNATGWVYNALLYSDTGQILAQQFGTLNITASTVAGDGIEFLPVSPIPYVPITRTVTINDETQTLSSNLVFTITAALPELFTDETLAGAGTEADPLAVAEAIVTGAASGATAEGWGNHADAGYLTSYIRSIVAAGDRVSVAAATNGTEVTYTVTADAPDLSGYVQSTDATYTQTVALAASALQAEADTLQTVVTRGGTVTSGVVTIDAANAHTNTFGGLLTVLGRDVRAGEENIVGRWGFGAGFGNTVGEYGFGAGFGNTVSGWGFGAGFGNTVGEYGFGAGYFNTVGEYGFGAGDNNIVGDYGFGAGRRGKGADGSFVFSDSEEADFDRTAHTNAFSVRASGGTYFLTPTFEVTGTNTAAAFTLDGVTITAWPSGTTDHTALDNLSWIASGHTGTGGKLAGFGEGNAADEITVGTGLSLDDGVLTATGGGGTTDLASMTGTAHRVWYTDSTGANTPLALGTAGQVLASTGTTGAPEWVAQSGGGVSEATVTNIAQSIAWAPAITPCLITYAATVTVTRAMSATNTLSLTLTGNTYITIQTNDWTEAEVGRFSIDLLKGAHTVTWDTGKISGTTVLDLSSTVPTPLFFRSPSGSSIWRVRQ
jgi:hypothetical protein